MGVLRTAWNGLLGDLREGVTDLVPGMRDQVDALREAANVASLAEVAVEDARFGNIYGNPGDGGFELPRDVRIDRIRQSYRAYFSSPVIKRGVDLRILYVFGDGVPMGRYRSAHEQQEVDQPNEFGSDPVQQQRQPQSTPTSELQPAAAPAPAANAQPAQPGQPQSEDAEDEEVRKANAVIKTFWMAPENQAVLTSYESQLAKDLELILQANVFLSMTPATGGQDYLAGSPQFRDAQRPALLLSDIPWQEITDVIRHPNNRKIALYYKREYTPVEFDAATGAEQPGVPVTKYYRHWRNKAPMDEKTGRPWGPSQEQIDPVAVIYPIQTNKTSDMKFGIPELNSVLKYDRALAQYLTSRLATVNLIAQMAFRVKGTGGPARVAQAANSLRNLTRYMPGQGGMPAGMQGGALDDTSVMRQPFNTTTSKIPIEGPGTSIEPIVQDTGAGNAATDILNLKTQIAAGMGLTVADLGGDTGAVAPMSGQMALQQGQEKGFSSRQTMWENHLRAVQGEALRVAGFDPERVEMQMPPIVQRDVQQMIVAMSALLQAIDPQMADRKILRFVMTEILQAMGKQNVAEMVDDMLGDDYHTPFERQQEATAANAQIQLEAEAAAAQMQGAQPGAPPQVGGRGGGNGPVGALNRATERLDSRANRGLPRGPRRPGGATAASQASVDRGRARRAREAGMPEDLIDPFVEAFQEVDRLLEQAAEQGFIDADVVDEDLAPIT